MFANPTTPTINTSKNIQENVSKIVGSLNLPENALPFIRYPDPEGKLPFQNEIEPTSARIGRDVVIALTAITIYPFMRMHVVPAGHIGLAWDGSVPLFYSSGRHFLLSPTKAFISTLPENSPVITHGNYVRIRVLNGQLGFGLDTSSGDPVFLTPGTHIFTSSTFKWIKFLDLSEPRIDCITFQWIRVETGKIGIAYINAELSILHPGLHLLRTPDRFHCFVSTQQQIITVEQKMESADYISIQVTADVFYIVRNPQLAFTKAFDTVNDLVDSIKETTVATLSMIVRSSTFAQIGTSGAVTPNKSSEDPPSYESYQKHLHDEFVSRLQNYMEETYGVFIENIRVKSLSIHDPNLAKKIAEPAVVYAQTQAALANVKSQTEIQTAEAHREATVKRIKADADAYSQVKQAESNCKAIELGTVAETNKIVALANAKANAVMIEAKADKERLELEGEGQRVFAQKVGESQLGRELALGRVQANSLHGIQKVIYAPTASLPAIMFSNMNQEKIHT